MFRRTEIVVILLILPLLLALTACAGGLNDNTARAAPASDQEAAVAAAPEPDTSATVDAASSPEPVATLTLVPSATASRTPVPTRTPTATPTETPLPTETPTPTNTPLPTATSTPSVTPTPTANAQGEIVHTVSPGETIYTIAQQYGVLWSQLTAYNAISATVQVGQQIRVPTGMMGQRYTGTGGVQATPIAGGADQNRVVLGPVTHDWQKLNNCGPTTTSVILSYYGLNRPQLTIAGVLKPNVNDKNVSPAEIATYVRGQGLSVFVGVNGDIPLLERLVAAGFPVMVEQWMPYDGGVGHYRAVRGFDRALRQILQEDTFLGPNIWRDYAAFNQDWAYFSNTYLVFYRPADEGTVAALVGADWNRGAMWQRALETFRGQGGALALYSQAEALHQLGNSAAAVPVFEQAIAAGLPFRYLWYRYGFFEALNNTGQYWRTLEVTAPILEAMGLSEDIRYHRAVAHRALGQIEQARFELQRALVDNPNFGPAAVLLQQLPPPPPPPTPTPEPTPEAAPPPEGEPPPEGGEPPPPPPEPTPGG